MKQKTMKTYLHGTSYESGMNIVTNGLASNKDTIWTCSDPNYLYCRDSADEEFEDEIVTLSVESGQIAAAYQGSMSTQIAVVRIEMDEDVAEDVVENDYSCENMCQCYQIDIDELNKHIGLGNARIYVDFYEDAFVPYLRPFYLAPLNERYMKIEDSLLQTAINVVKSSGAYLYDDILYYGNKVDTKEYVPMKIAA